MIQTELLVEKKRERVSEPRNSTQIHKVKSIKSPSKNIFKLLTGLSFLLLMIAFSVANNSLFLKELSISAGIIAMAGFLHLVENK